jgi:acyl-CoA hydrolase
MATTMSPEEAAGLLRDVDAVGFGLGPANPHTLFTAFGQRESYEDLLLGGALVLGLFDVFTRPGVRYRSGFFGPAERFLAASGARIDHVPAGFRQFGALLRQIDPRVMVVQATPPDDEGYVSLSLHYGATRDELLAAGRDPERLLMVEANATLPWTYALPGFDNRLHLDEIDVLVEGDQPAFELPADVPDDTARAIAAHALEWIHDGATLQTGIGAIPSMVAAQLAARPGGGYGVHSEMFTDGLMALHQAGKVTNQSKGAFDGVSVTTFAAGSRQLYDWLDRNPDVAFAPVRLVNDQAVIASNRRFVSINGAIMVDFYGQVVADAIDGRQVSGVGGHEDFIAGAELELDDHSLICLSSTYEADGELSSRIVPRLPAGAVVSTPRHHTAVVVTEHGSVDLRGLTVAERAHALVEVAHPDFRAELRAAAERTP